jgi:hypothetical protein
LCDRRCSECTQEYPAHDQQKSLHDDLAFGKIVDVRRNTIFYDKTSQRAEKFNDARVFIPTSLTPSLYGLRLTTSAVGVAVQLESAKIPCAN